MFDTGIENLAAVTEQVLGSPRRELNIDGWTEYNCPYCADAEGGRKDEKYNCCVNYRKGYFHCWKCGTSGKVSRVLKDYGGKSVVTEYFNEIRNIQASHDFQLWENGSSFEQEAVRQELDFGVCLPDKFIPITKEDKGAVEAYNYLISRGISYDMIREYKIGYIPWSDDYRMRCRVVIPSYDQYANLNYYVTRDYTGRQRLKYINPNVDKKTIIFNEGRINWGENITLCEGVFDSIAIPNSIPLLGKAINKDFAVYDAVVNKAMANVNILLDDDAVGDAKRMYVILNATALKDRVRLIECPKGYDASLVYEKFGSKGILRLMRSARKLDDCEQLNF